MPAATGHHRHGPRLCATVPVCEVSDTAPKPRHGRMQTSLPWHVKLKRKFRMYIRKFRIYIRNLRLYIRNLRIYFMSRHRQVCILPWTSLVAGQSFSIHLTPDYCLGMIIH